METIREDKDYITVSHILMQELLGNRWVVAFTFSATALVREVVGLLLSR